VNPLYSELQWLPRPPQDFSTRLKAIGISGGSIGTEIGSLAAHGLDLNQLTRLATVICDARSRGMSLHPLLPFRLAFLSNSTLDMIIPALIATSARHGITLETIQPSYDQVAQEALNPDSKVNTSKPDAVLFALDYRALPLKLSLGDLEAASDTVHGAIGYLKTLRNGVKANSNALCIFQTFAPPAERLFGSLDRALPGTIRSLIEAINRELASWVLNSGDVLLDVAGLAETVGLTNWHSHQLWNLGKFPFADELIPLYGDHVARCVAAIRGKSKKVLILDLDNTIWGGVIGDDGLQGIRTAQGDPQGEAHLALQRLALDLWQRGIVLAVSSKNIDSVAREPFLKHPELLLKLDHIAVFQANWNDKAANIQAIANELSLNLDAMVFLDDNPVERGLVRKLLPEVTVPELPEDSAGYTETLAAAGYFEAISFTVDDLKRARYYQDNAMRGNLRTSASNLEDYLASLEMTITFQPFDATGRARILQLLNKSNQYNLTTRRYTEPQIFEVENDPKIFTLQARLADIFGDNGMISVVICRTPEPRIWEIDTWLMSCRVLGRKVEHAVLRELLRHAQARGIDKLFGTYQPTERNKLVVDHYARLGFSKVCEEANGLTRWELLVEEAALESVNIKVISLGFAVGAEVTPK
jgi:FkbH-like protein